jgi:lysine N6-hydroxylase
VSVHGSPGREPRVRGRADVLAIGAGPANLSLAALADPVPGLDVSVLEARSSVAWHPGLLWSDSRLQVSPLKDLVTPVDPTSRFSFLSFLREHGRLYRHIIAGDGYVHRMEFSQYFGWAAQRMNVSLNERVVKVEHDRRGFAVDTNRGRWIARNLVLGIGSVPDLPACAAGMPRSRVWHVAEHLSRPDSLAGKRVAVVGGGQSAGEVMLDTLAGNRGMPATVTWIAGRSGLRPLDESPFTNEFFSPPFARYFQSLPEEHRRVVLGQQMPAIRGITADLLRRIYTRLYELDYLAPAGVKYRILSGVELVSLSERPAAVTAEFADPVSGSRWAGDFDVVLLATGFRQELPGFMAGLRARIPVAGATYALDSSFRVRWDGPDENRIYLQGGDLVNTGVSGQTLGLASWRSATIINSLLGKPHYELDGDEISIGLLAHPRAEHL